MTSTLYKEVVKKHLQEVDDWVKELTREHKLNILFSFVERRGILDRLKALFTTCSAQALIPRFDKETLEHLVCMSTKSMETLFAKWQTNTRALPIQEEVEEKGDLHKVTVEYHLTVTHKEKMRWYMKKDYLHIGKGFINRLYTEITEMVRLTTEYEEIKTRTKANLSLFLEEEEELGEYISPVMLHAKEIKIKNWVAACFYEQDIILSLDCEEPHLLRQLFTSEPASLDHVMGLLTYTCSEIEMKKRIARLSCRPVRCNDKAFLDMLRVNGQQFTNLAQYPRLTTAKEDDDSFLNLCTLEFVDGLTPSVYTILDEPAYYKMTERLVARKNFTQSTASDKNVRLIRSHAEKESNPLKVYETASDMMTNYMTPLRVGRVKPLSMENDLVPFLSQYVTNFATPLTGIRASFDTVRGSVQEVVDDAQLLVQQKGSDAFPDPLWLRKQLIPVQQFDPLAEPSPMDIVNRLMTGTQASKILIDKHVEKRMDVNVLSITHGESTLACSVIPCVINQQNTFNFYTVNNYIVPVEAARPQNKRKRIEPTLLEKIKRVRRSKDIREADKDIEIFRLETTWVAEADATEFLICIVCEKEKNLSSISSKKKRQTPYGEKTVIGIQNICGACLKQANII